MGTNKDYRSLTPQEQREARDARLAAQVDHVEVAKRRERAMVENLGRFADECRWFMANKVWLVLGYETFVGWWSDRIAPVVDTLGLKPGPELAQLAIEAIQQEEAGLPSAQRHSKKAISAIVGVGEWKVRGRQDPHKRRSTAGSDLDKSTDVIDGEVVDDPPAEKSPLVNAMRGALESAEANQAAAEPSAAGEPTPRQSGPDSPAGPVDACDVDGSGTQAGPGKSTADTVAGPVAGTGTADLSVPATPKDAPGMDGGEPDPVPADSPAGRDLQGPSDAKPGVANGRPETDHRESRPGEGDDSTAGSSSQPPARSGQTKVAGDETGPEAPSPDNASGPVDGRDPASNGFTGVRPFPVAALGKGAIGGEAVGSGGSASLLPSDPVGLLEELAGKYEAIDIEVVGPLLTEAQMEAISAALNRIADVVDLLAMWQSGVTPADGSHP